MSKFARSTPPAGYEKIADKIDELEAKMRDAENEPHEGKRKQEIVWPIFRLHNQKSRYVYEMYYKKKEISKEVYDYCINEKIIDASLIAKWRKPGYERLCCLRCIQAKDHIYGTTCICRVPHDKLEDNKVIQCIHCGCRGCASGEGSSVNGGGKKKRKRNNDVEDDEELLPPALRQSKKAEKESNEESANNNENENENNTENNSENNTINEPPPPSS